jgi:hypothetical protein
MNAITWIHIAGGVTALVCGAVAAAARKGGGTHVSAGTWFCAAMLVLGVTASILSPFRTPPESPIGGILICYFVATAWMAARQRGGIPGTLEKIACAGILVIAALVIGHATEVALAPPGRFTGPPGPVGLFVLGSICLLAGLGDVRFIVRGRVSATQRISRHLWRMCFAFFIATGSFFLGQQDVLPAVMRGSPVLAVVAFAPFALMLLWLVRMRFSTIPQSQHHAPLTAEE